jgi:nucleotide-binding universal stress UspA family protein
VSRTIEVELVASISTESQLGGAIIVASDGTHDSDGAVCVGVELGRRDGVNAALLSVVEPSTLSQDEGSSAADAERLTRVAIESREGELAAQHKRTYPTHRTWPFTIHVGDRVDQIVGFADHHAASLVVLGLGSHGVIARLLHRETALRVIRASATPVLAVPAEARGAPRSVIAAIDFTPSSEHAAQAALDLLGGEGTLYLAHVTPRVLVPQNASMPWQQPAATEVLGRLEAVARRLVPPEGVQIEFVSLHGEPAQEILAYAKQHQIDVIATGAHGRSPIGRLVLGSVSTKIIRSARCAVLVAPAQKSAPKVATDAVDTTAWFEPEAQPIG